MHALYIFRSEWQRDDTNFDRLHALSIALSSAARQAALLLTTYPLACPRHYSNVKNPETPTKSIASLTK